MFTGAFASPLPKHLLEEAYQRDKTSVPGAALLEPGVRRHGAVPVEQFNPGTSVVLEANSGYVLGRPKIDEIEVRFILDPNTLVTNLLSGSVELTLGRGFSVEKPCSCATSGATGKMLYRTRLWIALHPAVHRSRPGQSSPTSASARR